MKIQRRRLVSLEYQSNPELMAELGHLDRNSAARIIANLNNKVRGNTADHINEVFSFWFNKDNEKAPIIYDSIISYYFDEGHAKEELSILNLWTNFHLINQLLSTDYDSSEPELTVNNFSESEVNLFYNYLRINGDFIDNSNRFAKEIEAFSIEDNLYKVAIFYAISALPYYEMTYVNAGISFTSNFYKSFLFFSFLEEQHEDLLKAYLAYYEFLEKQEFFKAILPIATTALRMDLTVTGATSLMVEDEESASFLEKLTANSILLDYIEDDFVHLRANPLMKMNSTEFLIFDQGLAVNRIFASTFFDILKLIRDKTVNFKSNFFTTYTNEFVEKYLSYQILNKIFSGRSYKVMSGDFISTNFRVDTEPDFYVRNGKKVFMFETKGSIIRGDAKQSFRWEAVERELKKKFHKTDIGEKKAISQLVERIENLAINNPKAIYDSARPSNFVTTPILITTDNSLNTIGTNYILNKWFKDEIEESEILQPIKHRIKNLVVIDMDTLIYFSEHFKEYPRSFEEVVDSFCKKMNERPAIDWNKYSSFKEAILDHEEKLSSSFTSFAAHCIREIPKPKQIKEIMEFGRQVFDS